MKRKLFNDPKNLLTTIYYKKKKISINEKEGEQRKGKIPARKII